MGTPRLFNGVLVSVRATPGGTQHEINACAFVAGSEAEALGMGIQRVQDKFPRNEGWSHSGQVFPVADDLIEIAAANLKKR